MSDYDYYKSQFNKLKSISEFPITMVFSGDVNRTKYMTLNKDSLQALLDFIKGNPRALYNETTKD